MSGRVDAWTFQEDLESPKPEMGKEVKRKRAGS